jgi:quinol-cytochrome oxidoreductase complex cytochrome b subunit
MSATHSHEEDSIPFYPDHVRTEFKVVLGVLGVFMLIGLVGLFLPVGIGDPADPMNTPAHVKPEWYFLALYQVLKYVPKTAGVVAPVLAVLILTIWPFLDRKPEKNRRAMYIRLVGVVIFLVIFIALTIWGEVS